MEQLYVSQYLNIYASYKNSMIFFNGISGAVDEIDMDFGKTLKRRKLQKTQLAKEDLDQISESEVSFLLKRGHLTKLSPQEEIAAFKRYVEKMNDLSNKKRRRSGSLMIVPSYYCNLACPYCFQSKIHKANGSSPYKLMTQDDVDMLFQSGLPKLFPEVKNLNKISICLYGGEPFVLQNKAAVDRIMHYTTKHQMGVTAISNATEIHHFAHWFGPKPGHIKSVQISFDGGKECHDCSRIGKDRSGTFEKILENIHTLVDKKTNISIRINTHKTNFESIRELVRRLKEEELLGHPKVHVYSWAIHCHGEVNDRSKYFTGWELARAIEEMGKEVESPIGRRHRRLKNIMNAEGGLILKRAAFCMRNVPNAYLIDPDKDIYGCYEEAGRKETRIGGFSPQGELKWEPKYFENISRHVAMCEPCNRCSIALTCGGGCAYSAEANFKDQFRSDCDSHKECVAKAMQRLFKEKLENSSMRQTAADDMDIYPNA